jgi:hypothetical protein
MDSFDYKKYLKEGRLFDNNESLISESQVSEKKYKQGYDDREDESLGARKGAEKDKKQSFKDRRDDSYGKFGKRDAEAKGKAKGPGKNKVNKENVEEVGKGYFKKKFGVGKKGFKMADRKELSENVLSMYTKLQEGAYPFDECIADNEGKYGEEGAKKVCGAIRAAYGEGLEEKKELPQSIKDKEARDAEIEAKKSKGMIKMEDLKAEVREAIFDALSEESQYNDSIYSEEVNEQEDDVDVDVDIDDEVEADVDVDVKDKVNVDAEGDEIDIEKKAVKARVEVGLSPEEEIVQDSLKAAMDAADALGSEKLADQIGNTITFFTREFVVGNQSD